MKAFDRLKSVRVAIQNGEYQLALDHLVWFHHHALEEDEALRGVRLSFALADWIELGAIYPEALQVLHAVRDEKTSALLAGKSTKQAFIDVSAINEYLGDGAATYSLFQGIKHHDASLASECAELALLCIVAAQDFAQAKEIYGDPNAVISALSASLNEDVDWSRSEPSEHLEATLNAFVTNYLESVRMLLSTFEFTDGEQIRQPLRCLAIEKVDDEECRIWVANGI